MTSEPLVSELSFFEAEIAVEKLKRYKLSGIVHIPVDLIQTGGNYYILIFINVFILFGIKKKCHSSGTDLL
jgi:hypothetical protein